MFSLPIISPHVLTVPRTVAGETCLNFCGDESTTTVEDDIMETDTSPTNMMRDQYHLDREKSNIIETDRRIPENPK